MARCKKLVERFTKLKENSDADQLARHKRQQATAAKHKRIEARRALLKKKKEEIHMKLDRLSKDFDHAFTQDKMDEIKKRKQLLHAELAKLNQLG